MAAKKAFTLLEIIVVLVILGIFATIVLPSLFNSIEQSKAQAAQHNLLSIAAAQSKYYEDTSPNSTYCYNACANSTATTIGNLRLTIASNDTFTYTCSNAPAPYQCTATDGVTTLTLNPSATAPAAHVTCFGNANSAHCLVTCTSGASNGGCPLDLL